jgi:hypothetical protein
MDLTRWWLQRSLMVSDEALIRELNLFHKVLNSGATSTEPPESGSHCYVLQLFRYFSSVLHFC